MTQLGATFATHPGCVRTHNEDCCLALSHLGLWVVADGMGGHTMGAAASHAITDALRSLAATDLPDLSDAVRGLLAGVNDDLRFEAAMLGSDHVVGSTVVILLASAEAFSCLWAGDSRLYRLRDGVLQRMTQDHTPLRAMVEAGVLSPERAQGHATDCLVTRAVGTDPVLTLDEVSGHRHPDDVFLLCSDGLTKVVAEERIAEILADGDVTTAPQRLVDAALAAGAPDNVTALVVGHAVEPVIGKLPAAHDEPLPEPAEVVVARGVSGWREAGRALVIVLALFGLFDILGLLAVASGAIDAARVLALSRQVLSALH
jgi:serine/threonine protein phosphatase PrpC